MSGRGGRGARGGRGRGASLLHILDSFWELRRACCPSACCLRFKLNHTAGGFRGGRMPARIIRPTQVVLSKTTTVSLDQRCAAIPPMQPPNEQISIKLPACHHSDRRTASRRSSRRQLSRSRAARRCVATVLAPVVPPRARIQRPSVASATARTINDSGDHSLVGRDGAGAARAWRCSWRARRTARHSRTPRFVHRPSRIFIMDVTM